MGPADHHTCIAHAMAAVAAGGGGGGGGGGGQGQEEGGGGGAAGTAAAAAAFPATAVAASAAAASEEPNVKALQKRYDALFAVRSKAVKGKGAWYWSHLEPLLVPHPDTGNPKAVKLRCCLCSAMFSASNPSRTASEHLKRGTCPHFNGLIPKSAAAAASSLPLKSGASPAAHQQLQVQAVQQQQQRKRPAPGSSIGGGGGGGGGPGASSLQQHQQQQQQQQHQQQQSQGPMSMSMALAVVTEAPAVRSSSRASVQEAEVVRASPTPLVLSGGKGDLGALAQLEKSVKKLKSPGGCVKPGSGGPAGRQQADAALDLLSEWLYESCGTVPFSCVEHPKFRAFLAQLGLPSLSRRALQGDRLDAKFAQVKGECEAKLRDAMFFQLSAHGWRRQQHPQQHHQQHQQHRQQQQHEQQQQRPLMLLLQQPEHHHVHGGGGGVNVGSGLGHGHHGGYGGHGGLWGLQQYQQQQQQQQQQELLLHQQQQEGGTGGVQVSLNLPNGGAVFRGVIPLAGGAGTGSGTGRSSDSSSSGSDSENESSSGAGASAAAAEAGAVLEEAIMRLGLAGEPPERCVGVVADACSKARRRALAELENRQAWMVNLACQNAAFQGLLKDMHKHLHLLRSVVCDCSELHRLFTTDAAARAALQKLDMPMPMPAPPAGGGAAAPHPTFLFNLLDQVAASAQALQLVSLDDHLKLHCGGDKEKQELLALLPACSRFWHQLDSARALLRILHDMLADMAAERPMLSQCLPLWVDLRNKVKDWSAHYDQDEAPVHRLIDKRFRKNYHPAWAAAFILDPLYLLRDTSGKYLPPFKFLTPEQERDVDRLITRLVSKDEAHLALRELFNWRTVGLDPLYAQAVQVKERDPGSGRMKAVSPQSRRLVWETCLSEFKSLRKVATRLIFLHATSASVDCNWPLWRWAFRGSNASEKLDKLVFIAAQARLDRRGDFPAAGHQEGDLQDDAGIFINGDDAAAAAAASAAASAAADHHHLFFPSASSAL